MARGNQPGEQRPCQAMQGALRGASLLACGACLGWSHLCRVGYDRGQLTGVPGHHKVPGAPALMQAQHHSTCMCSF